eukprot:jgi/Chrzof1/3000/Cz12g07170.t1
MARSLSTNSLVPSLLQGPAPGVNVAADRLTEVSTQLGPSNSPMASFKPGSSPASPSASSVMRRMRSILRKRQCVAQQEAMTRCFQQSEADPTGQLTPCSQYIQALRYCELQTQQHNYPVNTSFLS